MNNNLRFIFLFFGKLGFQCRDLGVFFYLEACKKFLQSRYFFALLGDYFFRHGVTMLHFKLQCAIAWNWLFFGRDWDHVFITSNVEIRG